ncbi:MAG TPA: peptidoglycan DD-metalloendopeptidase family protein [Gemmatimonadales bacterium]|jgi:murein DD-endopeptidase MepM/ murein hydrolase activator NlpD
MSRRTLLFPIAVAILGGAAILGVRGQWPWTRLSDVPVAAAIRVTSPFRIVQDTLQRGETVSELLQRQGIVGLNISALANALHFDPRKIKAGLVFAVRHEATSDIPTHVEFQPNDDQRLRFIRTSSGDWRGEAVPIQWTTDTIRVVGDIESNLYDALDRGVADQTLDKSERTKLAVQLAAVNDYTIDFSRDLQPHDHFVAAVERQVSEDGDVRFKGVLADQFYVGGKVYEAFSYPSGDGTAFYDANGAALKRAFLMSPVEFRYISSGFSLARLHPILGIFRKHEGVDFAAAAGSPVRAAGDGVISVAGPSGGYGNMIEIHHRNGIVTRYGHLSHIELGMRPGVHVSQGEVIGLVGMTGLATAPHLHYEFRVDGIARDPRTIRSEAGAPLPPAQLAEFQHRRTLLLDLLDTAPVSPSISE